MKKRTRSFMLAMLLFLLVAGAALAMSSANYRLDWFVPLSGGGGGPANSAGYQANLTVGQTVIGVSSSASYRAGLGYWYGFGIVAPPAGYDIYLPVVMKGF